MRKPRKKPDEKPKKKLEKKQLIMLPFIMNQFAPRILEECLISDEQPFNIHVDLDVSLDGQPMDMPDNLGYDGNCIKPIHLHGEHDIHVAYSKEIRVTLFEFIKLWGINLDDYNYKIFVKLPESNEFQPFVGSQKALPLEDGMSIRIELTSKP